MPSSHKCTSIEIKSAPRPEAQRLESLEDIVIELQEENRSLRAKVDTLQEDVKKILRHLGIAGTDANV